MQIQKRDRKRRNSMELDRIGANCRGLKVQGCRGGKARISRVDCSTAKQQRTGFIDGSSNVCTRRCNDRARGKGEMILCAWRDLSWLRADVSRLSLSISLSLPTVKFSIIPKVIQGAGIDSLVSKEFNHFDRCVNR